MKNILTLITILFLISSGKVSAQNNTCSGMTQVCADPVLIFPVSMNTSSAPPGNNYGCLGIQPSPSWFYLEVDQSGDINLDLLSTIDLDFIIWGPFNTLADGQAACGNLGNAPNPIGNVDCGFLGGSMGAYHEYPDILSANIGEVYVMMLTNFNNISSTFTLTQIGGSGGLDCCSNITCPIIDLISAIPQVNCLQTSTGSVMVQASSTDCNVLTEIIMNGVSETLTLPFDTLFAPSGTIVNIDLIGLNGCVTDTVLTIPYGSHYIQVDLTILSNSCNGLNNGSASVLAYGFDPITNQPDGVPIASITWTNLTTGQVMSGGPSNGLLSSASPGMWQVSVTDVSGCQTIVDFTITEDIDVFNSLIIFNSSTSLLVSLESNPNVEYQWLNCVDMSPIPNATNQSFNPQNNGSYAVVLDNGSCIDTTECIDLVNLDFTNSWPVTLKMYPNPASNIITLELDKIYPNHVINILDVNGIVVFKITNSDQKTTFAPNLASGIYFVEIKLSGMVKRTKLIIE